MEYSQLLQLAGQQYMFSAGSNLASSFAQIAGSALNYSALKTDAYQLEVQAGDVELQAKQRANALREQFISAVGSYQWGAARRGISVQSGSVRSDVEQSAINLGKDIQMSAENASMQAQALRTQAKIMKDRAKAQQFNTIMSGITSAASAVGSFAVGYDLYGQGKMSQALGEKLGKTWTNPHTGTSYSF